MFMEGCWNSTLFRVLTFKQKALTKNAVYIVIVLQYSSKEVLRVRSAFCRIRYTQQYIVAGIAVQQTTYNYRQQWDCRSPVIGSNIQPIVDPQREPRFSCNTPFSDDRHTPKERATIDVCTSIKMLTADDGVCGYHYSHTRLSVFHSGCFCYKFILRVLSVQKTMVFVKECCFPILGINIR